MTTLQRTIYISRAVGGTSGAAVRALVGTAQMLNRRRDITGLLAYTGGHFVQVLEGHASVLAQTIAAIGADTRHCELKQAVSEEIVRRAYGEWSMAFVESLDLAERIAVLHGTEPLGAVELWQLAELLALRLRSHNEGSASNFSPSY